jgi:hypothetical protein
MAARITVNLNAKGEWRSITARTRRESRRGVIQDLSACCNVTPFR